MSRMYYLYNLDQVAEEGKLDGPQTVDRSKSPEYYLKQVHGGRMLHGGVRRTYKYLNKHFPGHRIPYHVVDNFEPRAPSVRRIVSG